MCMSIDKYMKNKCIAYLFGFILLRNQKHKYMTAEANYSTKSLLKIGKFLASPKLQSQHADLVVPTNKKKIDH